MMEIVLSHQQLFLALLYDAIEKMRDEQPNVTCIESRRPMHWRVDVHAAGRAYQNLRLYCP